MYQHPIQLHEIHCPLKYFSPFRLKDKIAVFFPPLHLVASQEVIICLGVGLGVMALPLFSDTYENDERCHERGLCGRVCVCGSVSAGQCECVVLARVARRGVFGGILV